MFETQRREFSPGDLAVDDRGYAVDAGGSSRSTSTTAERTTAVTAMSVTSAGWSSLFGPGRVDQPLLRRQVGTAAARGVIPGDGRTVQGRTFE
ncbi:hypothetical protein BRC99_04890 [Halobacteriales archaeon QS_7_69_60]|nr:MAG: hypothetical protein BRC99_04890 [Halobacteriales archaeon QS_7_69_60]